jgi:hypothetical protein
MVVMHPIHDGSNWYAYDKAVSICFYYSRKILAGVEQ